MEANRDGAGALVTRPVTVSSTRAQQLGQPMAGPRLAEPSGRSTGRLDTLTRQLGATPLLPNMTIHDCFRLGLPLSPRALADSCPLAVPYQSYVLRLLFLIFHLFGITTITKQSS